MSRRGNDWSVLDDLGLVFIEERKKIARRGYERVKTDHTYIERMRKMCNILKEENVL